MTIKTILIDDERKALAILKNKLERLCPNVEVIAQTQNPKEGLTLIKNLNPDLVFLDIAMPELSGFDVLKQLENPHFEIIFATAFDTYAIEAIKHCAIGYLVKPIDNTDLVEAVKNAEKNILEKFSLQKNKQLIENLGMQTFQKKKIIIPSVEGLEFIAIENILHCEGETGYTKIHLKTGKPLLSSSSIGHFNKLLENSNFYLVHKSHLINLNYIEKYINEGYVIISGNQKIPVSRNRRQDFLEHLKN
ncbi:LytR/AlgR family response regulator transcription factor [Siansivirga zeaxanthinifaciens]|uniref:LytR family transcriptional regulator n=1 Tax=Siansivirga zeaxanthinifaciens CC-SAMT-1 TaxID=1454006 RepID=A0A0C5WBR7_9FLAO|nr:LytTR family DNA-binding domain-containing protein [Siansivirga zeaxanthinifaciens]AJR02779.1 LytR family transcriptional regulator [Siansivirga zeaxanthinifaciens CC-SAMT-1]